MFSVYVLQALIVSFAEALQTAQGIEAADKNTQLLKGTNTALQFVAARPTSSVAPRITKEQKGACVKRNHHSTDCRFMDTQCHFWGKLGHIQSLPTLCLCTTNVVYVGVQLGFLVHVTVMHFCQFTKLHKD